MSYDIVRSINLKKRVVTAAENNVRPLIYTTSPFANDDGSTESFIKKCLVAFLDGDFQSTSDACWKFNYTIYKFRVGNPTLAQHIHDVRWNNYDYATNTKLYSDDEIKKAEELLKKELYNIFINIKPFKNKTYYLKYLKTGGGLVKVTSSGNIYYTYSPTSVKTFDCVEKAEAYLARFGRNALTKFSIEEL